ncbi:MAG TPA: hypothetical protein VFX50_14940, partial [Gemmatimonadales bacterium]|nr:hypothetical protein [Gemmatimonadales bacterium]
SDGVRAQLRATGLIDGPWGLPESRVQELLHLPVVVEEWAAFDALFAWDARPLRSGAAALCATYLGAAVRSFFAHGGRRAVIVRVGDPWPYLGGDARPGARSARLSELLPGAGGGAARPFDTTDPRTWKGAQHLYALGEVSHVCLPDLADACATDPPEPSVEVDAPAAPEVFVECSESEPALPVDNPLRMVAAPRVDEGGFGAWTRAVARARDFLFAHRKDALLLAALPLPAAEARATSGGRAWAQSELLAFLRQSDVLAAEGAAASAFIQLVWPWLGTSRSADLPELLEPGDGLLAGVLAANALARGTFRSAAGTPLPAVTAQEPVPDLGLGPDSPTARLAERVCLIGPEPDGIYLLSDVTTSPDRAWRSGGVSRLMATLLRAARRTGEAQMFEANGPELWARIRGSLEGVLEGFFQAG